MENIITKYLDGRASALELMQLLTWLRKKENRLSFKNCRLLWKKNLNQNALPEGSEQSWLFIQERMLQDSFNRKKYTNRFNWVVRIAAIFFFTLSFGGGLYVISDIHEQGSKSYTEVEAENGQISKVKLPDGSLVWLNSGSKLAYNNQFGNHNRDVKLDGEAYFHVKEDKELSFFVNSGKIQVKVYGTRFNVSAYPESENIDVVLESGRVQLLSPEVPSFQCFMSPGEKASFVKTSNQLVVTQVNALKFTSWKDGILNIYNQPLSEVVKRLEKRYNQQFEYPAELKDFRFTFTIKNESLEEIIHIMEKIAPIRTNQQKHIIVFKLDQNKARELSR